MNWLNLVVLLIFNSSSLASSSSVNWSSDSKSDFHDEKPSPNQNLMRREVNNWDSSDELFVPNSFFRNVEPSYLRTDSSYVQSEYLDENYPFDTNQRNDSSLEEPEANYQVELPQYYQKNYYYNYYPLVRNDHDQKKYNAQKFDGNGDLFNSEASNRNEKFHEKKTQKKNPCKLYLQFLKYAFKELDKNSDYDDFDEEYLDWEADGSNRVFATQLLGPTLYIDNSGRVFQVNSRGNSIQTVDGILPSSKDSPSEKDMSKFKLTTPNFTNEPKTDSSLYNSFIISYEHPPVETNENSENYDVNEKESQSMIPDEKQKKEPTYFTTDPTDLERGTTYTEPVNFFTTTFAPVPIHGKYFGRSGIDWEKPLSNETSNKVFSSAGSPLYFQRKSNPNFTMSSDKNQFRADTMVSFEKSPKLGNKEPDCNDKMLPCPDTINITYPLNGYCNRYVSCESGIAIRRTCSNGFHFNVITKSCDFPHNSICSYFCPEANGRFGIPGDCSGYFICENFIPEYRMCPPRMHWDVNVNSCAFAALSSCPMKCSKLNEIKPYKGDCKAYIICLNGIPYYHRCPPNLIYNGESQACVPENRFQCKNDPRLMTKTSNPSSLCNSVDQKLGTKAWCSYNFPNGNAKPEQK